MPIAYEVLFCDLFEEMVRPVEEANGSYFRRNNPASPSSLDIFVRQATSVKDAAALGQASAVDAAWKVAMEMKGLQGAARAKKATICAEVASAMDCTGAKSFADTVAEIAAGCKAAGAGAQVSAASKMVQVFPAYWDHAVIYDRIVRRALGPEAIHRYVAEFEVQMNNLNIVSEDGRSLTIREFFNGPDVKEIMKAVRTDLFEFIVRRSFDRALWLSQAAKDQWGSKVFGL